MMRLSRELASDVFDALLDDYQRLLREVLAQGGGRDVDVDSDTALATFPTAKQAARAAVAAQRAVAAHPWPHGSTLAISVGIHSGTGEGGFDGPAALRCAELCDAAEGGQIFLTPEVSNLLEGEDLVDLVVRDLGEMPLRRSDHEVRAYELVAPT